MKTISRYIMTLALLLTAVTGAWAADTYTVAGNNSDMFGTAWDPTNTANDMTKNGDGTYSITYTNVNLDDNVQYKVVKNHSWNEAYPDGDRVITIAEAGTYTLTIHFNPTTHEVYETMPGSEPADVEVTPGSSANTWTFTMPAFDVEIAPIYAKAAAFATTGTEPEVKTLLPEAAEGVIAGTDASLIAEGTGIVAFAGTNTEVTQGTLMYAIGTSDTEAPALTAFSATVPTAKNVDDDGADVYVWYYIKGADTPQGQTATAENTFNDSEICAEPLKVTVLSNKFDITFKAANDNTIEAGKATVTVGGTDATVTEGKLEAIKMGSEVKLEAKPGYKFRKVEVKKKAAPSVPDGAISGVFRVSDSKKVYFSKGNLRKASGAWSFFDNQYDYYTSYSADAWDHFGWSTSAPTYGMNTSTINSDYFGDFVDWGATMGTGWRTLSSAEWTYLFNTRSASTVGGTSNGRYAKAKVNNVLGVILFPDTYTHPDGVTAPTGVNATGSTGWNGNNYTVADWTKMESAGCVFLPAAGYRSGSSMNFPGTFGYYWSATPDGTEYAYRVYFNSTNLSPAYNGTRNLGYSVRLIREVTE